MQTAWARKAAPKS